MALKQEDAKQHSIHELDRQRLDPTNPRSVDPANTDPANEAEEAETAHRKPAVTTSPDDNTNPATAPSAPNQVKRK